ncbi:hypothetical protein B6U99_05135 [Candidatus Geothermarchaeota archaeon ex4572_27]|nr:MAG: hypothetical protein B6U99_05135 [Candidatus Geothermarchaeota archaeon ex4572_27]
MVGRGEFLGCHVPPELYRGVVEEARRRGTSVSGVIREALSYYLSRRGAEEADIERLKEDINALRAKLVEKEREVEALKAAVKLKEREVEELKGVLGRVEELTKLSDRCASKPAATLKGISERLKSYKCFLNGVRGDEDLIPTIRRLIEQAAAIIDGMAVG